MLEESLQAAGSSENQVFDMKDFYKNYLFLQGVVSWQGDEDNVPCKFKLFCVFFVAVCKYSVGLFM